MVSVFGSVRCSLPLKFMLRPHPSSNRHEIDRLFSDIKGKYGLELTLADGNQDIALFCEDIDICIGGHSSACKDILNHGVPVLYRCDLDQAEKDAHGWFELGLFYDFRYSTDIDMMSLGNFCESYNATLKSHD